ncbi:hypothetical protein like AT1G53530 [Hibiscus trionum]|uniref:Peptidase S26 domain-containing protein n=1 Tax=Hibiscus trionum TaxID=183268 RepID=A0A9W7HXD5_HIBTR|nr:hypothetical protein like AT1G53530 [Hibiscus trionum]
MKQWRIIAKEAIARASIIGKFLCLLHVTDAYVLSSNHVVGPSMLPTLNITGDVVLVEHLSHRLGKLGSGDLVLVRSPLDPKKTLTKRIVAMEGDKVTFSLDPTRSHSSRSLVVPKGHVWIQGDNLYVSRDSRHFGPLPYGLIEGKVFMRVWPPSSFGFLGE